MSIKDKLQIILITYNREKYARKTLDTFLAENSPVKDFDILILDNNSTDGTNSLAKEYMQKYPNVSYDKNPYNVGISGNIYKAMEHADKEYVWIIGDDDIFDFSNWSEVEDAINNGEKMICHARYAIPDDKINSVPHQLLQLTFITGGIYSTSLFNDTTMRNGIDLTYTLFSFFPPIIKLLNDRGKIYVTKHAITDNGMNLEVKDCSYTRGIKKTSELSQKTQDINWILGYCNVICDLKDKKLAKECLECALNNKGVCPSDEWFLEYIFDYYCFALKKQKGYFYEIYPLLTDKRKRKVDKYIKLNEVYEKHPILSKILSLRKRQGKLILYILFIKLSFKIKK